MSKTSAIVVSRAPEMGARLLNDLISLHEQHGVSNEQRAADLEFYAYVCAGLNTGFDVEAWNRARLAGCSMTPLAGYR